MERIFYNTKNTNRNKKEITNKKDLDAKFDDLYSLLHREDFIYQAITNLKNNKGTSTPGEDKKTLDSFSTLEVIMISEKIKKNEYKFKPIKRIMIPKPGKSELRPA